MIENSLNYLLSIILDAKSYHIIVIYFMNFNLFLIVLTLSKEIKILILIMNLSIIKILELFIHQINLYLYFLYNMPYIL